MDLLIKEAAKIIKQSKFTIAFTGAGISVESGIPPFRGEHGLWNKYNPQVLDLGYFLNNSENCWTYIREIFYDFFADAKPNDAHRVLAQMERNKLLNAVVTQNIDNLHYEAGSETVYEFHGNSKKLKCLKCGHVYDAKDIDFDNIPPKCSNDGEILKPDFIFFGEVFLTMHMLIRSHLPKKLKSALLLAQRGRLHLRLMFLVLPNRPELP